MKKPRVEHRSKKSGGRDDWGTPKALVKLFLKFDLDAAASKKNTVCKKFIDKKEDALKVDWNKKGVKRVWVNPPYSLTREFLAKAYEQHDKWGLDITLLLASRTDSKWFHDYFNLFKNICFIKGRLKFVGAKDGAPFPSMLVVFDKNPLDMPIVEQWALSPKQRGF